MAFDQEKFLTETKCDVCSSSPILGVASSGLGPVSLAFCAECAKRGAEPEFILESTYITTEGNVADWVTSSISTYKNGRYISWNEWVSSIDGPALIKAFDDSYERYCEDHEV